MPKNKFIFHSLCAIFFAAAPLAVAVTPGNAWDVITIDNETHRDKPSLVEGTYTDWTDLPNPWATGNQWPYVYNQFARNTSSWGGTQQRFGVAVWRVEIPQTGWYDLRASYKETDNRTTEAQYYLYVDATIQDIRSNSAVPIYHKVFNQHGDNWGQYNYVEFGAFCMKKGKISVLVLDARATIRSSSADAAIWKYLGQEHNGEECIDYVPPPPPPKVSAPINHLLLKEDIRTDNK